MRHPRLRRFVVFCLAVALLAALAAPALAQRSRRPATPPTSSPGLREDGEQNRQLAEERAAKDRASALLAAGNALLDQGQFVEALTQFEAAYAIFPSPKLHYNIAQTLHELGRPLEALAQYEAFLAGVAREEMAAQRELANQRVFDLQGEIAMLALQCSSAGAAVSVDGKPSGETPLPAPLRLMPGRHVILVDKPGFERHVLEMDLAAGTTVVERVELLTSAQALAQRQEFQRAEAGRQAAERRLRDEQVKAERVDSKRRRTWRTAGWISLGTGAVAAATALGIGGLALYERSKVEGAEDGESWSGAVQAHYDRAATYRGIFYVSAAVAVVGLATGAGFLRYASARRKPTLIERAALAPMVTSSGGGAAVWGRF